MSHWLATAVVGCFAFAPLVAGQDFSQQHFLSTAGVGITEVSAADLDGDGDMDVLALAGLPSTISWFENLSGGQFGVRQVLHSTGVNAAALFVIDLDGDGDIDVLSASESDDTVAWHENLGNGVFGAQQVLTAAADRATCVFAIDLDGDGDVDVLSSSYYDHTVAWFENLGAGQFGPLQVISTSALGVEYIYAADLDADGDADVLSADGTTSGVSWYENLGSGQFGARQNIGATSSYCRSVIASDLDQDGDPDVVVAKPLIDSIVWYENLGGGQFAVSYRVISDQAPEAWAVCAADLDNDGRVDILAASISGMTTGRVTWNRANGNGYFGTTRTISTFAYAPRSVFAADLDGDGDADVLSDTNENGTTVWYENRPSDVAFLYCFGDGADGIDCPCQNNSIVGQDEGCINSQGVGAKLTASGSAIFAADDLGLHVNQGRPNAPSVIIQGNWAISLPFRDGKNCVGTPTTRVEFMRLDATGSASSVGSIAAQGNVPGPGYLRHYQVWFRDPQISVCSRGVNSSNALRVAWTN